ncbi:hypothetical protein V5R04_08365 [Jonesiaceae bacterium BS-20]|uniref:Lipoprotein n=1 Tax=Jonesiaceae bacterium BS-20 TaxID=3120821 RepID=A0AAU7DU29_9MICO
MKKTTLFGAAAVALLFLSACSGGSAANGAEVTVEISEASMDADIGGDIGEQGFNSEVKDGVVILDTAGSSTCPPTIASGTYADGVLKLEREKYEPTQPCTMDYRTFRQEISLSDGAKFPDDVKVEVAAQVIE